MRWSRSLRQILCVKAAAAACAASSASYWLSATTTAYASPENRTASVGRIGRKNRSAQTYHARGGQWRHDLSQIQVGAGEDAMHTRGRLSSLRVDRQQTAMRNRTTDESCVERTGHPDIVDVMPLTSQDSAVFLAAYGLADHLCRSPQTQVIYVDLERNCLLR